jgi:iron complex transport system substrate-binding protein
VKRRALVVSTGALLLSGAAAVVLSRVVAAPPRRRSGEARVVSLSPALTETTLALGAGEQLVGVSDFCELPPGKTLPRVGSALTPNHEAIVALEPSVILCDASVGSKGRSLAALAPCEILPWLTLSEVVQSTRRLGQVLNANARASALAERLATRLSRPAPPGAPRVLLLLSYDATRPAELWFIKRNSLHGAALTAAGARNAVDRDVTGLPRLGVEELVALDPDVVLIIPPPGSSAASRNSQHLVDAFAGLVPLRAVQQKRVAVVNGTQSVGPSILQLVDALALALVSLQRTE